MSKNSKDVMIVTCPKCASRYEVDSSSISDEGTHAHCSNCEKIFFVKKRKKVSPPVETDLSGTNQSSEKTEDPPKTNLAQLPSEMEKSKCEPTMEKALESTPTPKGKAQPVEITPISKPANAGSAQDDIDALLSGVEVGGSKKGPAPAAPLKPVETPSEPFAGFGQDQEVIDALFGGVVSAPVPATAPDGTISQADLDSLFLGDAPEEAKEPPTTAGVPEASQDEPNPLLAVGVKGDESANAATGGQPAPAGWEPQSAVSEETIRSLLTEEGDGMASLFEEAVDSSDREQTQAAATTPPAPTATPSEVKAAEPRQTAEPVVQTEAGQGGPAAEGLKPEESPAHAALAKRPGKRRLPKLTKKQKLAAAAIAASAALAFFGGYRRLAGERSTAASEGKRVAAALPKQGAEVSALQPAAQPGKKIGPEPPQIPETKAKPAEDAMVEPAEDTEPSPPITAQPRAVGNSVSFGVIVPVDFNAQTVKVMTADVEVTFASANDKESAERRRFLYELAIEKEIGSFFKDKFYEDTHYVRDKLEAYLVDRVRKRPDLGRVVEINIENFDVR
ncbi:MAG: zinc-ribbon domain-containing protein [Nitrospinae bacterium]|nr:zinc-ribbon domain-containing protein [Nitrospinota bacterium]